MSAGRCNDLLCVPLSSFSNPHKPQSSLFTTSLHRPPQGPSHQSGHSRAPRCCSSPWSTCPASPATCLGTGGGAVPAAGVGTDRQGLGIGFIPVEQQCVMCASDAYLLLPLMPVRVMVMFFPEEGSSLLIPCLRSFERLYHLELRGLPNVTGGLPPSWQNSAFTELETIIIGGVVGIG